MRAMPHAPHVHGNGVCPGPQVCRLRGAGRQTLRDNLALRCPAGTCLIAVAGTVLWASPDVRRVACRPGVRLSAYRYRIHRSPTYAPALVQ